MIASEPTVAPTAAPQVTRAANREALKYLSAVEKVVQQCESLVPRAASLGDAAAASLAQGGTLYISGDPGLVEEACGRAGGLMMTQPLGAPAAAAPHSVVIYGWKSPRDLTDHMTWLRTLKTAGVTVIGIGTSAPSKEDQSVFPGALVLRDVGPTIRRGNMAYCPVDAIGNAVNLWTLTGEIISGLSRRHQTATIWQSIWVPGSKERNAPRIGHAFDPTATIPPIAPGVLAREYTQSLLHSLRNLRPLAPEFAAAAQDLHAARLNGGTAQVYIVAHMVSHEIGGPDDPGYLKSLPDPVTAASIKPGDALLGLGYVGIPDDVQKAASASTVPQTWFVAPGTGTGPTQPGVRWIDAQWKLGDTAVAIPGYDVGALPPSGVLQLTAYWMVNAAMVGLEGK